CFNDVDHEVGRRMLDNDGRRRRRRCPAGIRRKLRFGRYGGAPAATLLGFSCRFYGDRCRTRSRAFDKAATIQFGHKRKAKKRLKIHKSFLFFCASFWLIDYLGCFTLSMTPGSPRFTISMPRLKAAAISFGSVIGPMPVRP